MVQNKLIWYAIIMYSTISSQKSLFSEAVIIASQTKFVTTCNFGNRYWYSMTTTCLMFVIVRY
jgi:hypothetical protein